METDRSAVANTHGPVLPCRCVGRQSLVRFCNRAGLPPERSFSVQLHGSASTAAYGKHPPLNSFEHKTRVLVSAGL